MTKITSLSVTGAFLACGLSAAPAHAQANRTFVSGTGTDAGACTRPAPCRSFDFAITQTAAGGEIDTLDPAGYGLVTITKAISIFNGAGFAGIQPGSGLNGVTIKAGAGDSIHLRGLTIEGLGGGLNGIQFTTGGNLEIENCVIRNFANTGINIVPSMPSSFSVSNTIASNNGNVGIFVQPAPVVATGVLSKVTANNNAGGILVNSNLNSMASLNVVIVDSEASNNTNSGIAAVGSAEMPLNTSAELRNVVASYNSTGLFASQAATLRVARSVVTGNVTGVNTVANGMIFSYGDNDIDGNTNNNTGVLTPLAMH